ncbi:glycosyltransferase family 2 protein [Actinoplanes subtropicus]|uniref:glycosyltransferase family 2 protein n=1 Tax=Actinoplanes subtropicus TaxID=543632 RepID=UPI0004C3CC9F|nr:glycosyltransferase family A protein [Actinoplanes subtropicus]
MRFGYVCWSLSSNRSIDMADQPHSLACAAIDAGHEAYLIGAEPPAGRPGVAHVPLAPARADHQYLTASLGHADRVYDTLRAVPFDVVVLVEPAAAFTALRAKRLLGEFAETRLVIAANPAGRPAAGEPPASLAEMVDRHLEDYCRRYADAPVPTPAAGPAGAEPPLVSVLIPIRDQGHYLTAAIDSARRCGHQPLEIVVVDDGSTDPRTLQVLDGLTGVVTCRQSHRGLPAARNAGLAAARGEFVVPLDADDELPPGFVGAAVRALTREPGLGAVGGSVHNVGLLDHVSVPVGFVPDLSLVVNTFGRATAVLRTAALRSVGGYDEKLPAYEDWDLYLRLHKAGWGVEYLPLPGQVYRRHADSMTFRQDERSRIALTQRLLRTHADLLTDRTGLLLTLVDLWKSRYEPSASVALRQGLALVPAE